MPQCEKRLQRYVPEQVFGALTQQQVFVDVLVQFGAFVLQFSPTGGSTGVRALRNRDTRLEIKLYMYIPGAGSGPRGEG